MSNTISCRIKSLGKINAELLKKALKVIAQEEKIKASSSFKDYYGNSQTAYEGNEILGALATEKLPRGIGIFIDKEGYLNFAGDPYNCKEEYEKMKARIVFTYQKLCIILAYQAVGYTPKIIQNTSEIMVIEGGR